MSMTSSITLLKRAIQIFKNDAKRYLIIAAIPAVISFALALVDPATNPEIEGNSALMLVYTILMIASIIAGIFMTIALVLAVNDPSISPKESFLRAKKFFFRYVGLMLLMTLIVMVGLILLVIPGIWLSVLLSFGMFFLLLEGKGIKASLTASKELVTGRWWAVAIRFFVVSLIGVLVFAVIAVVTSIFGDLLTLIISSVLGLLITPIWIIYSYELYKELKNTQSTPAPEAPVTEQQPVL